MKSSRCHHDTTGGHGSLHALDRNGAPTAADVAPDVVTDERRGHDDDPRHAGFEGQSPAGTRARSEQPVGSPPLDDLGGERLNTRGGGAAIRTATRTRDVTAVLHVSFRAANCLAQLSSIAASQERNLPVAPDRSE